MQHKGLVRGSNAREELSPHIFTKLAQREKFDLELYDYAVRLFLEQLAAWARSSASPVYAAAQQSLLSDRKLISGEFTSRWMHFTLTSNVHSKFRPLGFVQRELL